MPSHLRWSLTTNWPRASADPGGAPPATRSTTPRMDAGGVVKKLLLVLVVLGLGFLVWRYFSEDTI